MTPQEYLNGIGLEDTNFKVKGGVINMNYTLTGLMKMYHNHMVNHVNSESPHSVAELLKNMSMDDAIEVGKMGFGLKHKLFIDHEWMTINDNNEVLFEDGYAIDIETFKSDRKQENWQTGWSIDTT